MKAGACGESLPLERVLPVPYGWSAQHSSNQGKSEGKEQDPCEWVCPRQTVVDQMFQSQDSLGSDALCRVQVPVPFQTLYFKGFPEVYS